jgi:hypothetical protein
MNTPSRPRKGYVVSDLHIFSCASLYERRLPEFFQSIGQYTDVVLNGDTFDFKRSVFSSSQETSAKAIEWLRELCERFPHTTFHYLLGNHDCNVHFVAHATTLAQSVSNLAIIQDSLLLGSALFIHGDVTDLPSGSLDLTTLRTRYAHAEPNLFSKIFANVVTHLRINSVEYLRHSKQSLACAIINYLQAVHPEQLHKATQIYFGHTHVPFTRFQYDRFTFHNTGSLVRGLVWMPLEFEINPAQ